MQRQLMLSTVALLVVFLCALSAFAQLINGTGSLTRVPGQDGIVACRLRCIVGTILRAGSVVQGALDTRSGVLSVIVQLETDSYLAGPKGRVTVTIKDTGGKSLTSISSDEIGMGGKPPGRAVIRNFSSTISIPTEIALQARSLYLDAQCTGSITRLFNISLEALAKPFNLIVSSRSNETSTGSPESKKLVTAAMAFAGSIAVKGTPSYTATLREAISRAAVSPASDLLSSSPGTLYFYARYRNNFSNQYRIWGGEPTNPGTFPDTVAITGNGRICTGILISPNTVLTAAHCYCAGVTENVYIGDSYLNATLIRHVTRGTPMTPCAPEFKVQEGDVAVLTLDAPLTISSRAFASPSLVDAAKVGRAVGFGVGANPDHGSCGNQTYG